MPYDIKNKADSDIDLSTGDIQWSESTYQHMRDLVIGRKYDYRQQLGVGVGAEDFINDTQRDSEGINREVRLQFIRDGMTIIKLNYPEVDAKYKDS